MKFIAFFNFFLSILIQSWLVLYCLSISEIALLHRSRVISGISLISYDCLFDALSGDKFFLFGWIISIEDWISCDNFLAFGSFRIIGLSRLFLKYSESPFIYVSSFKLRDDETLESPSIAISSGHRFLLNSSCSL